MLNRLKTVISNSIIANAHPDLLTNVELVVQKQKTTNEIIDEIHETFYTEVDRILADAKILKSTETNLQPLINKCEKLKALGFTNTKEVIEAQKEINRLKHIESENANKNRISEAVNYFSIKYPNNKFITEESVKKICEKYGLVYGTIDKYIGTVPDKNLAEIANFKLHENDVAVYYVRKCYVSFSTSEKRYIKKKKGAPSINNRHSNYHCSYYEDVKLEIVAPLKDFNMESHEIKDFKISKIEIPDPVVLQPVIYDNTKYYLILSAWGQESSDELVVNQKFN